MTKTILIQAGPNGLAEDKEQARRVRIKEILPVLEKDRKVVLDFSGVSYATQSYIHALIGESLQRHGVHALELVEFKNCSPTLRSVIELVVDYSLGGFPEQRAL